MSTCLSHSLSNLSSVKDTKIKGAQFLRRAPDMSLFWEHR